MTIVLVTNLVQQARRLADRTAFFSDSRLIEVDETETIFTKPAQQADRRLRDGRLRLMHRTRAGRNYSIRTRGLNLWYGDFQALQDIEINIARRCVTALIGPSGCGKTTLLRCFNRINERYGNVTTTGEITILGKNIYDPDVSLSELRKSVGMVFQRPNPLPISIYENVLFGVRVHTDRGTLHAARARRDGRSRPCTTCSCGTTSRTSCTPRPRTLTLEQQQKLCIARLLPLKPRVILMDEPCSALDAEGTRPSKTLIDDLREKFTIVIVTHNMGQAGRASDECIFMLMGRMIEHGKTMDIFLHPQQKRPKCTSRVATAKRSAVGRSGRGLYRATRMGDTGGNACRRRFVSTADRRVG